MEFRDFDFKLSFFTLNRPIDKKILFNSINPEKDTIASVAEKIAQYGRTIKDEDSTSMERCLLAIRVLKKLKEMETSESDAIAVDKTLKIFQEKLVVDENPAEKLLKMADWVNVNKKPVSALFSDLSEEEIEAIIPHITYLEVDFNLESFLLKDPNFLKKFENVTELKISSRDLLSEQLPPLTKVEIASFSCQSLKEIGDLPAAKTVEIRYCPLLTKVGRMDVVLDLKIDHSRLLEIGDLPAVQKLYVLECRELVSVGNMPALKDLSIIRCGALSSLGETKDVQKISILNCSALKEIRAMPLAKEVRLVNCEALQSIGEMVQVEKLSLFGCPSLQTIHVPQVKTLEVEHCRRLEKVGDLPNAVDVRFKECKALRSLGDLPVVLTVYLENCEALESIGNMVQVNSLEIRRCNSLSVIGLLENPDRKVFIEESKLPEEILERVEQPKEFRVPIRERILARLEKDGDRRFDPIPFFDAHLKNVRAEPFEILSRLGSFLAYHKTAVEFRVNPLDSQAADATGVLRAFITALVRGFQEDNLKESEWYSDKNDDAILEKIAMRPDGNKLLHTLGTVFFIALTQENLTLGTAFNEKFFAAIKGLSGKMILSPSGEAFMRIYMQLHKDDTFMEKAFEFSIADLKTLSEEKQKEMREYVISLGETEIPEGDYQKMQDFIRENLNSAYQADPYVFIVYHLAKGMFDMSERLGGRNSNLWQEVQRSTPAELDFATQGSFTKDHLKSLIRLENANMKGFIFRWIDEASDEQVQDFVEFATGSRKLGMNEIQIRTPATFDAIVSHTCFNQLDIPECQEYGECKIILEALLPGKEGPSFNTG